MYSIEELQSVIDSVYSGIDTARYKIPIVLIKGFNEYIEELGVKEQLKDDKGLILGRGMPECKDALWGDMRIAVDNSNKVDGMIAVDKGEKQVCSAEKFEYEIRENKDFGELMEDIVEQMCLFGMPLNLNVLGKALDRYCGCGTREAVYGRIQSEESKGKEYFEWFQQMMKVHRKEFTSLEECRVVMVKMPEEFLSEYCEAKIFEAGVVKKVQQMINNVNEYAKKISNKIPLVVINSLYEIIEHYGIMAKVEDTLGLVKDENNIDAYEELFTYIEIDNVKEQVKDVLQCMRTGDAPLSEVGERMNSICRGIKLEEQLDNIIGMHLWCEIPVNLCTIERALKTTKMANIEYTSYGEIMSLDDEGYDYLRMFKSILRKFKDDYLELVSGDMAIFELPGLDDDNVESARLIVLMEDVW